MAKWLSRYILNEDQGLRMLYNGRENIPAKDIHKDVVIAAKVLEADLKNTDAVCFDIKYSFLIFFNKSLFRNSTVIPNNKIYSNSTNFKNVSDRFNII